MRRRFVMSGEHVHDRGDRPFLCRAEGIELGGITEGDDSLESERNQAINDGNDIVGGQLRSLVETEFLNIVWAIIKELVDVR